MRFVLFVTSLMLTAIAHASSTVNFPVKHQKIDPYPGQYSFIVNGPVGQRDNVYYTLNCVITNPNDFEVIVRMGFSPYRVCNTQGGCGQVTLNDKYTGSMLHLAPGRNELIHTQLMTANYNPNTSMIFTNYDNDGLVYLESCKSDIE